MSEDYVVSAFYKAYSKPSLVSNLIGLFTFSNVSHVENISLIDGKSYSSTMQKGDGGCRGKAIEYKHTERWIFVKMRVNSPQSIYSWEVGQTTKNKGYDVLGCLSLAWIRYRNDPDKWFCSEFCRRAYTVDGTLPKLRKTRPLNPSQLKKELIKNGGIIVEFDPDWINP